MRLWVWSHSKGLYPTTQSTTLFCAFKRLAAATEGGVRSCSEKKKSQKDVSEEEDETKWEAAGEGTEEKELCGVGREWNKMRRKGETNCMIEVAADKTQEVTSALQADEGSRWDLGKTAAAPQC